MSHGGLRKRLEGAPDGPSPVVPPGAVRSLWANRHAGVLSAASPRRRPPAKPVGRRNRAPGMAASRLAHVVQPTVLVVAGPQGPRRESPFPRDQRDLVLRSRRVGRRTASAARIHARGLAVDLPGNELPL